MGWLNQLLGTSSTTSREPVLRFGRYTDTYKQPSQYAAWDRSLQAFEEGNYLDSYLEFFNYLRDEREDNVRFWQEVEGIRFELFQGSKRIIGTADQHRVQAAARIARAGDPNIGFLRRLLEKNYGLKYSRFGLDDQNHITIVFDSHTVNASPYKLYFALKELAVNADKQDDLLLEEFKTLEQVDTEHLIHLPDNEKSIKYIFTRSRVENLFNASFRSKLNQDQYPDGFAYLLLNTVYKLDYLIRPEGYMMEALERMHRQYFAEDDRAKVEKNRMLWREFEKLRQRSEADFYREMYDVRSTFGITAPVYHDRLTGFIDTVLPNMDWYLDQGETDIALAIPGYIIGYALFNYALPKPDRDLFHLYYSITEPWFFTQLGFSRRYTDQQNGKLDKKAIRKAIKDVVDGNKEEYPKLNPALGLLNYNSLPEFARSFLLMIRKLDFK